MTREEALFIAWHTKRDPESLADLILRIDREAEERTARECAAKVREWRDAYWRLSEEPGRTDVSEYNRVKAHGLVTAEDAIRTRYPAAFTEEPQCP
jgi:hypothetical protein